MPIWSFGLLTSIPFLRLAIARRRVRDWCVFAIYLGIFVLYCTLINTSPKDSLVYNGAMIMLLITNATAAIHAFIAFSPTSRLPPVSVLPLNQLALVAAQDRIRRRAEARQLALSDPVLARELRIGRPDMTREYDDGGLIDANNLPMDLLASLLKLTTEEAASIAEARSRLGRFVSAEELTAYSQLAPDRMDALRDLLWFG